MEAWQIALIIVCGQVFLCSLCALGYFFHHWKKLQEIRITLDAPAFSDSSHRSKSSSSMPSMDGYITSVKKKHCLGQSDRGSTFYGVWSKSHYDTSECVLKKLDDTTAFDNFHINATKLQSLSHEHVLGFYGFFQGSHAKFIVNEWAPMGNLGHILRSEKDNLRGADQMALIKGLVRGMECLASNNVVHGSLDANNVMVSVEGGRWITKVADYSIYSTGEDAPVTERIRWSSVGIWETAHTTESDVFSTGVVMWYILRFGLRPWDEYTPEEVVKLVKKGIRLEKPPTAPDILNQLLFKCWNADWIRRPPFEYLAKKLEAFENSTFTITQDIYHDTKEEEEESVALTKIEVEPPVEVDQTATAAVAENIPHRNSTSSESGSTQMDSERDTPAFNSSLEKSTQASIEALHIEEIREKEVKEGKQERVEKPRVPSTEKKETGDGVVSSSGTSVTSSSDTSVSTSSELSSSLESETESSSS